MGTVPVRADWCGIPPSAHMLPALVAEKDMYAAAARAAGIAVIDDMTEFTAAVLAFWRGATQLKAWRVAARIVFSITPNSAGAERVFSLLKLMYGPNQMDLLSDAIEAGLMLRHNERVVG